MIRTLIVVAALALASCGPAGEADKSAETPPASEPAASTPAPSGKMAETQDQPVFLGDPCSAELYQDLIGRTEAYARSANLPQGARVICNGCMKTMDHSPERLNVEIGTDGNVAALSCG